MKCEEGSVLLQYMKFRANGHLLQDPILCNPPAQRRRRIAGVQIDAVQYIIVRSLRFVWNACGLRAAQSSITDTAYDAGRITGEVEWAHGDDPVNMGRFSCD